MNTYTLKLKIILPKCQSSDDKSVKDKTCERRTGQLGSSLVAAACGALSHVTCAIWDVSRGWGMKMGMGLGMFD